MSFREFLKTKFASVVLTLILAAVLTITARLFVKKYEVKREIERLESEAEAINQKNLELTELIKYFETDEYAQKQAREKLNLKKEGEYVVSLPKAEDENVAGTSIGPAPNWKKWYDYFFSAEQ